MDEYDPLVKKLQTIQFVGKQNKMFLSGHVDGSRTIIHTLLNGFQYYQCKFV